MFKISKNNTEFIFLETSEKVVVYKNKNQQVSKVADFKLAELAISLDKLKKEEKDIIGSKNIWILDARSENIEKVPLNKEEMISYAKWKIQEIIDVSLHDVYYDILTNNNLDGSFYKKYATAIIAKKSHIDNIVNTFGSNKIPLFGIDSKTTVLLDFFSKHKSIVDKKSLTFLKIEEDKAIMYVFYDFGVVFDRVIELPRLKQYVQNFDLVSEDDYRSIVDKICLEIQRNVDYLDRQYGIQHFENIVYSLPKNEIFKKISGEISEYFSVKELNLNEYIKVKSEDNSNIPLSVLGVFDSGSIREEHINLIPRIEKHTGLKEDLKKVVMVSVLLGLAVSIVGGIYEWKNKGILEEVSSIKKENAKLDKDLSSLRAKEIMVNPELEKEIANLIKNKDEIIRMQSQELIAQQKINQKIMKDIAIQAKNSNVVLTQIKFNTNGLLLIGNIQHKDIFSIFLKNLQTAESLKGFSLNVLSVEQKDNMFEFKISSENMAGGKI